MQQLYMKKNNIFASIYTPSLLTMLTWACFSILTSCVAKKEISKTEETTVENKSVRIDTIFKERIKTIFESVNNEVIIPCDSTKFNQSFDVGKIKYKIIKEKGSVRVVFKRDSSQFKQSNEYKYIYRENDSLKRIISIQKKEIVKKPFFANLWQILFFIILFLWFFGITPKFLIGKFFV